MSTVQFNTWQNTDGTENYKCRAWVNFNGTGTVAIRASGNVSSVTDNGTGIYTINFTNAMPDANYGVALTYGDTGDTTGQVSTNTPATGSVRVYIDTGSSAPIDRDFVYLAIFR